MQDVEKVIKRSRRYWYVDGITELYMGSISLLAGLFYLGFQGINALLIILFGPPIADPIFFYSHLALPLTLLYIVLFLSLVCFTLLLQWRATKFRESFTYPRIGYLAPRQFIGAPNLILATIFIGIQLLLAYLFITPLGVFLYISPNLILFGGYLFFSCLYLYPAISCGLKRFYVLSAVSTLLSIILFQTSIRPAANMLLYTTLMGVALLVSGGFTFQNFSHHNPLPQEELVTSNDSENADQDIEEPRKNQEIMDVYKRSPQYWFINGTFELNMGGNLIAIALYQLSNDGIKVLTEPLYSVKAPQESLLNMWQLTLLQNCLFLIFVLLLWYLLTVFGLRCLRLQHRFCTPRLRYLISRSSAPKQLIKPKTFVLIVIACAFFVPLLILMVMLTFAPLNIAMFGAGLSVSFIFLCPAISLSLNRYYILTALSILLSIVLFQSKVVNGIALYQILMGVALMISGWLTFQNFVRKNPLPPEEV